MNIPNGTAVPLPPLTEHQQRLADLEPIAESLMDRVMLTIGMPDGLLVDEAQTLLYRYILTLDPPTDDEDENHDRKLIAGDNATFLIGVALGRRLGPKGGAR